MTKIARIILGLDPHPCQIIRDITTQDAFTLIQNNEGNADFVILDVRTLGEYSEGHIENALNMDYYSATLVAELGELDKTKTYLVYCSSGSRSRQAVDTMAGLDFWVVYNMLGGITKWVAEGLPIVQ